MSKELKYNILFCVALLLIGETWDLSVDLVFNRPLERWFNPGTLVLLLTISIAYFSVYSVNYLVFAPRYLRSDQILQFVFSIPIMAIIFAGIRFLLEEVVLLYAFGFHNYNLDRPNIVIIYLTDSLGYAIKPILFSSLMFLFFKSQKFKARMHQIELQHEKAQLAMLRSQISPHFLFNILNGFYSDLHEKHPKSAEGILKLSNLLRYVTYGTRENEVGLKDEINFITDYLYFYRKRYEDGFYVNFELNGTVDHQKIPALLLIHFVENLCKHGIIDDKHRPAEIKISVSNDYLQLETQNAINPSENYMDKGIGSDNLKKRLELLYQEQDYVLYQIEDNQTFKTYLKLPFL